MQKPSERHKLTSDNNIIKFKKPVHDHHKCTYSTSESTFTRLTTGKMVDAPGAWSKSVFLILLMSSGCVLGVTCNKPIRVSSGRSGMCLITPTQCSERTHFSLSWKASWNRELNRIQL